MNLIDDRIVKETRFLTAGDAKKFAKGIKMYGKNFLKIKSELLPRHERVCISTCFHYNFLAAVYSTCVSVLSRKKCSQVSQVFGFWVVIFVGKWKNKVSRYFLLYRYLSFVIYFLFSQSEYFAFAFLFYFFSLHSCSGFWD